MNRWIALIAVILFSYTLTEKASATEQISIQHYSGSNVIPQGQSTGSVTFMVTCSNLTGSLYYGYVYKIDDGSWSDVVNIGFVSGTHYEYPAFSLGDGGHTIYVRLVYYDGFGLWAILANNSTGYTMYYGVTVQNSYGGGNVTVDGNQYSSGTTFSWHGGQQHTLAATDNYSYGGYVRAFQNWSGTGISGSGTSVTETVSGSYACSANFLRVFNVTVQNNFPGYGSGGSVLVNSTQYGSPASGFTVTEGGSITVGVVSTSQTFSYVDYTFSTWSPGGNGSSSQSFSPGDHSTYSATFSAKPQMVTNMQAGAPVGYNVVVSWTDNPNSDVTQYRIFRKTKHGSDNQVATVNSGVESWTDQDFVITGTGSDSMLTYSIYAYYSPSGTLSDAACQVAWATFSPKIEQPVLPAFSEMNIPASFAVGNYPNPFNPSTFIRYSLPIDASVSLEIFDIMGRKVRSLLDGGKSAGYHTVVWNGRDNVGKDVASGTYLYRFVAVPSNGSKAFDQSGKLMLTR